MTKHPAHINEISPEWLTWALQTGGVLKTSSVVDVKISILGEGIGFISSMAHVEIQYDHLELAAPNSVVIKIEPDTELGQRLGNRFHAFEREIRFYRELAQFVPIPLAKVYCTLLEPPHCAIIMEGLTDHEPGDQVAGIHGHQILTTARTLGELHGRFWNNSILEEFTWLPAFNSVAELARKAWPEYCKDFGPRVGAKAIKITEQVINALPCIESEMAKRNQTLVHNDMRGDNLLFSPSKDRVIVIDWQIATRNLGAYDIVRLFGGSEPPEERDGHELEVIRCWFESLIQTGVCNYSFSDAIADAKLAALYCLIIPVRMHSFFHNQKGRPQQLLQVISQRHHSSASSWMLFLCFLNDLISMVDCSIKY